ncbi:hypothetical protein ACHAXA_005410 [Cyclostephanos tholiformis]|uniref:Uncharacterized protein n=1 Tax=Cyclostephanos tholiformis TaxID=382380 RepID=A0ABD3R8R6_9STRA
MSTMTAAKRKFFQSHDPYVKYHPRNKVVNDKDGTSGGVLNSSSSSVCTIFGSTFSTSSSFGNEKYLIACTSNGCIAVWDCHDYSRNVPGRNSGPSEPILTVSAGGGKGNIISSSCNVLYDLQFVEINNGDRLLVASGEPGILMYKWSHFEAAISAVMDEDGDDATAHDKPRCQDPSITAMHPPTFGSSISPIVTLKPHPSPVAHCGGSIEINSTCYNKADDTIVGAAGDMFGCYQWDVATERLLGTFAGVSTRSDYGRCGHKDYLHVVKSLPGTGGGSSYYVTGGEDGNIGFWDGKTRGLVEMMNVQATMDKNKDLVTSNIYNGRGFLNSNSSPTPSWNNIGSNISWVSSMDISDNWLAVCGGSETLNNNSIITSRTSAGGFPGSSGFLTLWHLPTRTFASGCITRESLNAVAYNDSLGCFVTGGNECRISFWDSIATLGQSRGRSWRIYPTTIIANDVKNMAGGIPTGPFPPVVLNHGQNNRPKRTTLCDDRSRPVESYSRRYSIAERRHRNDDPNRCASNVARPSQQYPRSVPIPPEGGAPDAITEYVPERNRGMPTCSAPSSSTDFREHLDEDVPVGARRSPPPYGIPHRTNPPRLQHSTPPRGGIPVVAMSVLRRIRAQTPRRYQPTSSRLRRPNGD